MSGNFLCCADHVRQSSGLMQSRVHNGYEVSVGHQRVWYAKQKGYTHIDCYHIPNQAAWEKVFSFTQSNDYWKKYSHSEKCKLS